MTRALALALVLLVLALPARAQETTRAILDAIELAPVEDWAGDGAADMRSWLTRLSTGDFSIDGEALKDDCLRMLTARFEKALGRAGALFATALLWAIVGALRTRPHRGTRALECLFVLGVSGVLIDSFSDMLAVTVASLSRTGALTQALCPILGGLIALGGKTASGAMFTPVAALAGGPLSSAIQQATRLLPGALAAVTVAGRLSDMRLDGLAQTIKQTFLFALGLVVTVFGGILAVRGVLAKGYDMASIETAKFAIGNLVPVVGGEIADSLEVLVASATLVKNALGVTGLLLLLSECVAPMLDVGLTGLCCKLVGALVEPLADGGVPELIRAFSGIHTLLLAALAAQMLLFLTMIGAALQWFGGG